MRSETQDSPTRSRAGGEAQPSTSRESAADRASAPRSRRRLRRTGVSLLVCTSLLVQARFAAPAFADDDAIKLSGTILQVAIPAAGLGMTAYHKDLPGAGMWALSGVVTTGVTWGLKVAIDRDRPSGNSGHSMPSGHAAVSAWGAGFIHRRYGFLNAIPAYLGAGYVAWTRVHVDYHREEEVVVGAAIGVLSSFLLTKEYAKDKTVAAVPVVGAGFYGLRVSATW